MRRLTKIFLALAALALSTSAGATPVTLSTHSSEVPLGPSVLDATFDFSVAGTTLTLSAVNDTTAPDEFNINQVYFNASSAVTSLTLTSATHSVEGDVLSDWLPLLTGVMVDGFGVFDFGMQEGVGENAPAVMGPSESVTFVFSISGTGPFTDADFIQPSTSGFLAAAKFVSGPPPGPQSALGATVPEPSTGLLLASGLILLGARRRSSR
jgi:hypothetical protein